MTQQKLPQKFHNYLDQKYPNSIIGVAFPTMPPTDPTQIRVDFVNGVSAATQQNILNERSTYDWTQQDPDLVNFEKSINTDSNVSITAKLELSKFYSLLEAHIMETATVQGFWQEMIGAYGATWLTSNIQTIVQNYSKTYNIGLV